MSPVFGIVIGGAAAALLWWRLVQSLRHARIELGGLVTARDEAPVRYWVNLGLLAIAVTLASFLTLVFLLVYAARLGLFGTDF